MSPTEYAAIKEKYLIKLRAYFPNNEVACQAEAPEKADHGDIDIFVSSDNQVDFLDMARSIGATGLIIHGASKCTLGVAKEEARASSQVTVYQHIDLNRGQKLAVDHPVTSEEYAQIDVAIISTSLIAWHTFHSSYGDLNTMIGRIMTPLGFTVTDKGLWLRMEELDASKDIDNVTIADEDGKLLLSTDPNQVMQFLGLSVKGYEAGFSTIEQFYQWMGACRLIAPETVKVQRMRAHYFDQKRTTLSNFYCEWLPEHLPEMDREIDKEEQRATIERMRKQYLHEAVTFFDKEAEYATMHDPLALRLKNAIAANLLRQLIAKHSGAAPKKLPELVRAFRRWVRFTEDGEPYVGETAMEDSDSQLHRFLDSEGKELRDEQATEEFVRLRWEELKALQRKGKPVPDGVAGF